MNKFIFTLSGYLVLASLLLAACRPSAAPAAGISNEPGLKVLAVETFLADIAQNVAGDRLEVDTLLPIGVDPHSFEPVPGDVARIAGSQVLIANGAGFEEWLQETLENAGGESGSSGRLVIEAAAGLPSRESPEGEVVETGGEEHHEEGDPHFWLDPTKVVSYVENIRAGLSQADPGGREIYARNAEAYIAQLEELDRWISEQVEAVPPDQRLLVTNHESFGYFADRYGFRVIGTIVPSTSTGASPSAQQLARLVDHIRETGAKAIFLETGTNPQLAEQVARETGVKVVTGLYSHSISAPNGEAPTYINMMKYNTKAIVDALK